MSKPSTALGRHLITELYDCTPEKLDDVSLVEQIMTEAAHVANATIVSVSFHHFMPYGVSGVIVIQESHLTIHTWPEYGFASLDIYTCGDDTDPWKAVGFLERAFGAGRSSTEEFSRGDLAVLSKRDYKPVASHHPVPLGVEKHNWHTDLDTDVAISFSYDKLLHRRESAYQRIEVYQTKAWGKALAINGKLALTESDEAAYHEMAVHVPLSLLDKPESVLIIGGGDGGMAKECLKHPSVTRVLAVEKDKEIAELANQFFPAMAQVFASERTELICAKADESFFEGLLEYFDLIIIDGIEPETDWRSFHQMTSRWLKPHGLYLTSIASPRLAPAALKEQVKALEGIFEDSKPHLYNTFLPSCPTGMWTFGLAAWQTVDPSAVQRAYVLEDCQYYNDTIHHAAFAQPNFVGQILK